MLIWNHLMAVSSGSRRRCTRPSPSSMYSGRPPGGQCRADILTCPFVSSRILLQCVYLAEPAGQALIHSFVFCPAKADAPIPAVNDMGMCAVCASSVPAQTAPLLYRHFFFTSLLIFCRFLLIFRPAYGILKAVKRSASYSPHPRPVRSVSPDGAVLFLQPEVDSAHYLSYTKRKRKEGIFHDS